MNKIKAIGYNIDSIKLLLNFGITPQKEVSILKGKKKLDEFYNSSRFDVFSLSEAMFQMGKIKAGLELELEYSEFQYCDWSEIPVEAISQIKEKVNSFFL